MRKNNPPNLLILFLLGIFMLNSCNKETTPPEEVIELVDLAVKNSKDMKKDDPIDLYVVENDLSGLDMNIVDPYLYVQSLKPVFFKAPYPYIPCGGINCLKAPIYTHVAVVGEDMKDSWTSGPCTGGKSRLCDFVLKNSVILDYN